MGYGADRITPQESRQELTIYLYLQGLPLFGKAGELANMNVETFQLGLISRFRQQTQDGVVVNGNDTPAGPENGLCI